MPLLAIPAGFDMVVSIWKESWKLMILVVNGLRGGVWLMGETSFDCGCMHMELDGRLLCVISLIVSIDRENMVLYEIVWIDVLSGCL